MRKQGGAATCGGSWKKGKKRRSEQSHVLRWSWGVERQRVALLTLWPLAVSVSRRGVDGRQQVGNAAFKSLLLNNNPLQPFFLFYLSVI